MAKNDIILQKGDIIEYKKYVEQGNGFAIVEKPKYAYQSIGETIVREIDKLSWRDNPKKLSNVATGTVALRFTQAQLKEQFGFDFSDIDTYVKEGFVLADSSSVQDFGEYFLKRYYWTTSKYGTLALDELKKRKEKYDNRLWAYGFDPETRQELFYQSDGFELGEKHKVSIVLRQDKDKILYQLDSDFYEKKDNLIDVYLQIERGILAFEKIKNETIQTIQGGVMISEKYISWVIYSEFLLDNMKEELLEYAEINKTPDQKSLNLYLQFNHNAKRALK